MTQFYHIEKQMSNYILSLYDMTSFYRLNFI